MIVVFLGPSLRLHEARSELDAVYRGPVAQGDVYRAVTSAQRPDAIGIIDGQFDHVPAVWHKEILWAMDQGIRVYGSASMGALRAAELGPHGVIGVGRIFAAYRDGELVDDGEVALLHADGEHGYRPLTLPLVQVRVAAGAARAAGLLGRPGERALVAAGTALHYTERTWPRLIDAARLAREARGPLAAFLPRVPDQKAEDARACLREAAAFVRARRQGAPPPPRPTLPPPPAHVRRARLARARSPLPDGRAALSGEVLAALARRPDAGRLAAEGLRRALLAGLARSLGLAAGPAEAEEAERAWLGRLGIRPARRDAFLAACGLDEGEARRLSEGIVLEARLLGMAERVVPDGPAWEEGLALAARLSGAWVEEAARVANGAPRRRPRRGACGRSR